MVLSAGFKPVGGESPSGSIPPFLRHLFLGETQLPLGFFLPASLSVTFLLFLRYHAPLSTVKLWEFIPYSTECATQEWAQLDDGKIRT